MKTLSITPLPEFVNTNALDDFRQHIRSLKVLMSRYRSAMMEVETKFKVLNEEFSLANDRNHIESIKVRLKSMDSILEKLHRRGLPMTVESVEQNLTDVAGVRVICPFVDDIYVLVDCLLRQTDVELLQVKDYIKHPKENGYRSLHLIITVPIFLREETCRMKVEVQLRTIAMDFWASLEHQLRYKKDIPQAISEKLSADLKECADISAMLDQRMQDIKDRIE
ncbi:MAG: GTP pyrophosphokinase family protein [Ruminococcaceae bacterium]|nr:GTP pyrophosphokinase family protein [Oscillospiraceae bacterium]